MVVRTIKIEMKRELGKSVKSYSSPIQVRMAGGEAIT